MVICKREVVFSRVRWALIIAVAVGWAMATPAMAVKLVMSCGTGDFATEVCLEATQQWEEQTGHTVEHHIGTYLTSLNLGMFQQLLAAQSTDLDILQIDVIWPGMLHHHLLDLRPYLPPDELGAFLPALIANNTAPDGSVVALPQFTDVGMLYYRKDLLEQYGHAPPSTWDELERVATDILNRHPDPLLEGFLWQGKPYEGLTCNALEWIASQGGGSILDSQGRVTVNNPQAIAALERATRWIGTITPYWVLHAVEEDTRRAFHRGHAIFMRNWPYVWHLIQTDESPVQGKVGIMPLPKAEGVRGSHVGALGGWSLAVNRYSKHPQESVDLIRHLTSYSSQVWRIQEASLLPTRIQAYQDEAFVSYPFYQQVAPILHHAIARPSLQSGFKYNRVSKKFWNAVSLVLQGQQSAAASLQALETELNQILEAPSIAH